MEDQLKRGGVYLEGVYPEQINQDSNAAFTGA